VKNVALSKRQLVREAQDPAKRTAMSLFKIMQFLFHRVPVNQKKEFFVRLRGKVIRLSPGDIGMKNTPPSAAVGQSVGIAKNLLAGLNPDFVRKVLVELVHILTRAQGM
jgi:hypothetical protein